MSRVDWEELHWQIAYERIDPFEDGYIQSAKLISVVAGAFGSKLSFGDIYPHFATPKLEEDPRWRQAKMALVAAQQRAVLKRNSKEVK